MSRHQLLGNALKTGLGNLASRMSGLIREILFSAAFGTSAAISQFMIAFAIPNLSRRILGEGALNNAFIPLLQDKMHEGKEPARLFTSQVFSCFLLINSIIAILVVFVMLSLGYFFPQKFGMVADLVAMMSPYLPLICLCGILSGCLNVLNVYGFPAILSGILNIILIVLTLTYLLWQPGETTGVKLLSAGVVFAGALQLFLILHRLKKIKFNISWRPDLKSAEMKILYLSAFPLFFAAGIQQISTAADKFIAISINDHAVAALSYSERLIYLPIGIFGVALGQACLPALSRACSLNEQEKVDEIFGFTLRITTLLTVPYVLLMLLFGHEALSLIYQRGAFGEQSLKVTLQPLLLYAPGIPAYTALKSVLPLFYSHKDTRTPFRISVICILINLVLGISLIPWLEHGALALATSVAAWINLISLVCIAHRRKLVNWDKNLKGDLCKLLGSSLLASIPAWFLGNYLRQVIPNNWPLFLRQGVILLSSCLCFLAIFVPLLLRQFNWQQLKNMIRNPEQALKEKD